MRVAIVHDYIKEYGGAERVLEALHELYPEAPVYTSLYLPEFLGPHKNRFARWNIKTSILQEIPYKEKLISLLRIVAPAVFYEFEFSEYDVVIVSATGAYTPNMIKKNEAIHITYCHTPPRYLYGFATARDWKKNIVFRILGEVFNHVLRMVDFQSSKQVDFFIANSVNVQKRIEKFYRRSSVVIYPPVNTPDLGFKIQDLRSRKYYVAGGRLARPKHIDLIVKTCAEFDLPLIVFGKSFAGYEVELKSQNSKVKNAIQNSKIKFVGEVGDEEKLELMRNANAFIFAAEDEDFGITPVEALSVGTPVIAYRSGGVVESVEEGKSGIFFDELTVESLQKALTKLSKSKISPEDCIERAKKFSKERFKTEIQLFVDKAYRLSS